MIYLLSLAISELQKCSFDTELFITFQSTLGLPESSAFWVYNKEPPKDALQSAQLCLRSEQRMEPGILNILIRALPVTLSITISSNLPTCASLSAPTEWSRLMEDQDEMEPHRNEHKFCTDWDEDVIPSWEVFCSLNGLSSTEIPWDAEPCFPNSEVNGFSLHPRKASEFMKYWKSLLFCKMQCPQTVDVFMG